MVPKGFRTFAAACVDLLDDRAIDKRAPIPDALVSYLLGQWAALPESVKTQIEGIETAREQQNKPAAISTQHTFPQSWLHDLSLSVSAWKRPAKLIVPGTTAASIASQHVSSSSPSTTPSPSTPFLSPSPFCSPRHIPHDLSHNISTVAPSPSQPEPLNIGDNWPGVQYGASRRVEFLMENQPSHSVYLYLTLMPDSC